MNKLFNYYNRYGYLFKIEYLESNKETDSAILYIPKEVYYTRQGGEEGNRFIDFEGGPFIMQGHSLPFSFSNEDYVIDTFEQKDSDSLLIHFKLKE